MTRLHKKNLFCDFILFTKYKPIEKNFNHQVNKMLQSHYLTRFMKMIFSFFLFLTQIHKQKQQLLLF